MTQDFRIRLLIVDDEQTIRRLCMTVGESLGFFCLEAESGDAALALLEEQPVHMVLTDMVMPRMSGLEFLEQAKRAYPRIEVAVMTSSTCSRSSPCTWCSPTWSCRACPASNSWSRQSALTPVWKSL